jgi:hypothetical protein
MYRLCHIAHKGFDVGHGGGAVLGKELDDGAADDGTIADFGHGGSLLRGGNAKADGAHDIQYLKAGMLHRGAWSRMVVAQPEMSSIVSALVLLVESAARNAAFWVGLVCPLMISFMTS